MKRALLPPLSIRLGLIKNFVKSVEKQKIFSNTCALYSHLSVLLRSRMIYSSLLRSENDNVFEELVTLNDLRVRETFKSIYHAFLGNTPDYQDGIKNLLQACEYMERQISLKQVKSLLAS